jgi:hypothetical protein
MSPTPAPTRVDEIVDGIHRICSTMTFEDGLEFQFNQFLIDDERPALIHTGMHQMYDSVRDAVAEVLDPAKLAYVTRARGTRRAPPYSHKQEKPDASD